MCPKKSFSIPYNKSKLEDAIKAVQSGTLNIRQAASVFGVPTTTIGNNLRKRGISSRKKKKEGAILANADHEIIKWVQLMNKISCSNVRNCLSDIVNEVLTKHDHYPSSHRDAGSDRVEMLCLRHPTLHDMLSESESNEPGITAAQLDTWMEKLKLYFHENYSIDIEEFTKQSRGTEILCCFKLGSIVRGTNGSNSKTRLQYRSPDLSNNELLISLYCCLCADGTFLKPAVIVEDEQIVQAAMEGGMKDFHLMSSDNAAMNNETATCWLQLIDIELKARNFAKPALLYIDQDIRTLSVAALDLCKRKELMVFYLPGRYTSMKLPFGMDILYSLNKHYESLLSLTNSGKREDESLPKIIESLMAAWKMMLSEDPTVTEFQDYGLAPLDTKQMLSMIEAIVPLTMSVEEASAFRNAQNNIVASAKLIESPDIHNSGDSSPGNFSDGCSPVINHYSHQEISRSIVKEHSDSDNESETENVVTNNAKKNVSDHTTAIVSSSSEKPKLKMKFKRSDRVQNKFSIEQTDAEQSGQSESLDYHSQREEKNSSEISDMKTCDKCEFSHITGMRTGVIRGLVFALKRIESSLRADTLDLYKTRYLSPHVSDPRPTEPSFMMWFELMKCIEMGPDAVQKDHAIARSIPKDSDDANLSKRESSSTLDTFSHSSQKRLRTDHYPGEILHETWNTEILPSSETSFNVECKNTNSYMEVPGNNTCRNDSLLQNSGNCSRTNYLKSTTMPTTDTSVSFSSMKDLKCDSNYHIEELNTKSKNSQFVSNKDHAGADAGQSIPVVQNLSGKNKAYATCIQREQFLDGDPDHSQTMFSNMDRGSTLQSDSKMINYQANQNLPCDVQQKGSSNVFHTNSLQECFDQCELPNVMPNKLQHWLRKEPCVHSSLSNEAEISPFQKANTGVNNLGPSVMPISSTTEYQQKMQDNFKRMEGSLNPSYSRLTPQNLTSTPKTIYRDATEGTSHYGAPMSPRRTASYEQSRIRRGAYDQLGNEDFTNTGNRQVSLTSNWQI